MLDQVVLSILEQWELPRNRLLTSAFWCCSPTRASSGSCTTTWPAHGYDDLGRSDGVVFRMLNHQPRTVSELAERLEISKQGAAQIIDDMQRRGYVVRTP